MIPSPVRFVVFRYGHHSPHSGYSRLAEYGVKEYQAQTLVIDKPLSRRLIRERLLWRLAKGTPGYDRAALAGELKVAGQLLREAGCIYHFLYGETTYHYAGLLNNLRRNRLVATFHQPIAGIQRAVQIDWHIRQLSAVVCVGSSQAEFFAKLLDPGRIFFVPLGVDTEYFCPPSTGATRDPNLCLFVGENYRDFPTLRGVIELVAYWRPQTRFVAVTSAHGAAQIGCHPNLTVRSGVPEAEFRELYRSAALMLMPLQEATANNAILESMACGLPLVVTETGSIRDYVAPQAALLTPPRNARRMAEAVIALLDDPQAQQQKSMQARAHALHFAWPTVVQQLQQVYTAIA
ncbi:MAG: glycosyltransferase family 4 protein [Caldilineaceae bacterium]|nr:glycosyltransferase family 4 protein [Caldilineaceae bacterium]MCB0182700.1 glycosyltransferase family 4 protein [Caldilineaceae bacterium]